MTNAEARAIFQAAVDAATDPETRATRELLREYFTNDDFRVKLNEYVYQLTK